VLAWGASYELRDTRIAREAAAADPPLSPQLFSSNEDAQADRFRAQVLGALDFDRSNEGLLPHRSNEGRLPRPAARLPADFGVEDEARAVSDTLRHARTRVAESSGREATGKPATSVDWGYLHEVFTGRVSGIPNERRAGISLAEMVEIGQVPYVEALRRAGDLDALRDLGLGPEPSPRVDPSPDAAGRGEYRIVRYPLNPRLEPFSE